MKVVVCEINRLASAVQRSALNEMGLEGDWLASRLMIWIPLVLSLTVHEWAHAWSAYLLGDDTAKHLGRLTLNPLDHIDPIGTVVLPLLGVPFGWAKPVPIEPLRFRRGVSMRWGIAIVAAAGPISNIVLALSISIATGVVLRIQPELLRGMLPVIQLTVTLNVLLAVFNMLPIPPLDGSRIVDSFIPARFSGAWSQLCQMGPMALIAVIVLPALIGISLFARPMEFARTIYEAIVKSIAG